ncbi:hypothetical protein EYF80_062226 [Liparis tanakae]|uniref:Uncharacterized protein n=1 Tax=Liparis tanakae TaxID=230148 RepID=A0A4Z2EFF6_9TELE|nr:hypothetical protein EYF80_062226 [Liparis tanakae]
MAALFVGVMPGAISRGQRGLPGGSAAEKITQNKERRREAVTKENFRGTWQETNRSSSGVTFDLVVEPTHTSYDINTQGVCQTDED